MPTQLNAGERSRIASMDGRTSALQQNSATSTQAVASSSDASKLLRARIQDLQVSVAQALRSKQSDSTINELRRDLRNQQAALTALEAEDAVLPATRKAARPFGLSAGEIVLGNASTTYSLGM